MAGPAAPESGSDGEEDDDTSEESSAEPPPLNCSDRAVRTTAGRSLVCREGKDKEDDQAFWGHADFQEASSDSDVEFEDGALDEEGDSSDSDIDAEEDNPDQAARREEAAAAEPEDTERRKTPVRPFARLRAGRGGNRQPPVRPGGAAGRGRGRGRAGAPPPPSDRTIRESTLRRRGETEARRVAEAAKVEESGRARKQPRVARLTQQERLDEAARTEARNLQELQVLQGKEEDLRQQARGRRQRKRREGALVRLVSRLATGAEECGGSLIGGRAGVVSYMQFVGCDPHALLRDRAG